MNKLKNKGVIAVLFTVFGLSISLPFINFEKTTTASAETTANTVTGCTFAGTLNVSKLNPKIVYWFKTYNQQENVNEIGGTA